jgi:uncharacterized protein
MKFVIFALAVVALLYLLKSARRRVPPPESRPPAPAPSQVQDMVACAHCGVHLPRPDALPGRGGVFCGEAHRTAYEQGHPEA